MKTPLKTLLPLIPLILLPLLAPAAVPLRWTVETSRLQPAVFDAVRGETLELEAAFKSYGKPVATSNQTAFLCWQTNGMGSVWWTTNAVTTANVARVLFTPRMDPGAPVLHGFIGLSDTTNQLPTTSYQLPTTSYQLPTTIYQLPSLSYRAAFTLRYRHGPGETPNAIPLPTPTIDCAKVTFLHPESAPFSGGGGGGLTTNQVSGIITNHVTSGYLCTVAEAQAKADAARDAAKEYADGKFLPLEGGNLSGTLFGTAFVGQSVSADSFRDAFFNDIKFYSAIGNVFFTSYLRPDNSPVVTSNMMNAVTSKIATNVAEAVVDGKFTTNNTALVSVVTNLSPTKARGISLSDPVRHCNWYQVVTNGVFFWLVEE